MKKLKKGLKVLPKKILSLFLAIATLFTNLIPLTTVFAITGEARANLVEIKLRRANDIRLDGNTATIDYNGGNITVTGANLDYEIDHNYDYGNDHGTIIYLYTNSTSLNFVMHPDENHEKGYWLDGRPERLDGNEYSVNNLQLGNSYEYEFFFNYNEPYEPHPTGASYMVDFEENEWTFDDVTVYASIPDKVLDNGPIEVIDTDIITLHNFDQNRMEARVTAEDGFSIDLVINGDMTTSLANLPNNVSLPQGQDLIFSINPRSGNNENTIYRVDFGNANWQLDDECFVSASIDDMVINNGPVDIDANTTIHLNGFDRETMRIVVIAEDGFTASLFADDNMDTRINYQEDNQVHIPNVVRFEIQRKDSGGNPPEPWEEDNPEQDGNTTAIVRIWGADGTYEDGGDEHPYNGPGEIWSETRFNINGGAIYMFKPEGETFDGDNFLYNEIEYKYDEEANDTHISLGMYLPVYANRKFTSITINGTPYPIPLDFSDRDDWLTHIVDSYVGFTLNVPKTNNNTYEIVVQNDPYDGMFIGGFFWTNDPNAEFISDEHGPILNEFGELIKNDSYMPHVNVELLEVSFDVSGHEYIYTEEDFQNDHFDGEYISYNLENHLDFKVMNVMFPSNAIFKIRITPDYGYQIGAIHTPGDGIYTKGEEPGEFIIDSSHMLRESDFSVEIAPGEDTVQLETDAITEANITLPNNTILSGNINLIVDDIEPTPEEVSRFENYANSYEIKKYLNIHLDQVFFNGDALEPVFVHIDNLNNKATISLKLAEGIDGDKIVILHDINNNGTMELIEIDSYDKNTNVITFKVDSFSNFAIASKTYTEITDIDITLDAPVSGEKINVNHIGNENIPDKTPNATTTSELFTIDATEWVNGTCNGESSKCDELFNGTFQAEDDYYAKIYISSNEGYKLTLKSLENIKVNDRTLSSAVGDEFFNVYGTEDETNTMFIVKIKAESAPITIVKGDMNQNGKIDLQDIIYLLKKYLGVETTTEEDIDLGDMDDNGSLGLKDIVLLLKSYLGIE